jgi:hypothetical protein
LVIHKEKESFLVVPLLTTLMKKDLSEITGWVGPTKKGMGVFGHKNCLGRVFYGYIERSLTSHFLYICHHPIKKGPYYRKESSAKRRLGTMNPLFHSFLEKALSFLLVFTIRTQAKELKTTTRASFTITSFFVFAFGFRLRFEGKY